MLLLPRYSAIQLFLFYSFLLDFLESETDSGPRITRVLCCFALAAYAYSTYECRHG